MQQKNISLHSINMGFRKDVKKSIPVYCVCENCGDPFEIYRKRSRFCGVNCRRAHERALKKQNKE